MRNLFKKLLLIVIVVTMAFPTTLFAAAGDCSINGSTSVEVGQTASAKVTFKGIAAWNIKIEASGACESNSKKDSAVDDNGANKDRTFTLSVKATEVGEIIFKVTGDVSINNNGNIETVYIDKTYKVTVVEPRQKDAENRLNSLAVNGYNLSPAFSPDVKDYTITVQPQVESLTISGSAMSEYAKVSGTGKHKIDGDCTITVACTSETGEVTNYNIRVSVFDSDPITFNYEDEEYTVIKKDKNLATPMEFEKTITNIQGYKIPAFSNDTCGMTLVCAKDSVGRISYFVYDNGAYKKYNQINVPGLIISIEEMIPIVTGNEEEDAKLVIEDIEIEGVTYHGYKVDDRMSIVYGLNVVTGERDYYNYDSVEKTFQHHPIIIEEQPVDPEPTEPQEPVDPQPKIDLCIFFYTTIGFGLTTLLLLILLFKKKENKDKYNFEV